MPGTPGSGRTRTACVTKSPPAPAVAAARAISVRAKRRLPCASAISISLLFMRAARSQAASTPRTRTAATRAPTTASRSVKPPLRIGILIGKHLLGRGVRPNRAHTHRQQAEPPARGPGLDGHVDSLEVEAAPPRSDRNREKRLSARHGVVFRNRELRHAIG